MDFSRLHTYIPPQCVPENTGYTYALSSSYSSSALDFETEHKLDPVFDSPRMSRRSLRLSAKVYNTADNSHNDSIFASGKKTLLVEQSSKITKQHRSVGKQSGSLRHIPRKNVPSSSVFSHSSFSSHNSDGSFMSTILDESSIQEQTAVDHFWGLDDDSDLKGGDTTVVQANGDLATAENQTLLSNGYTCNDCSMLSERKEVLTAYSAPCIPSSRVYSRDRSQKQKSRGLSFYTSKILQAAKHTAASFTSLIVQLFQMMLLKPGYACKAHSDYCGSMNVKEFLREDGQLGMNGETLCDDCKGKRHLETYTSAHLLSSSSNRVISCYICFKEWERQDGLCQGRFCHSFGCQLYIQHLGNLTVERNNLLSERFDPWVSTTSYTEGISYRTSGFQTMLQRSLSVLNKKGQPYLTDLLNGVRNPLLKIIPCDGPEKKCGQILGKVATGVFWCLGTGWYQLVTLISLLNVFLLTRCLPKMFRLLLFLLPLLLLLGLWHWATQDFYSLLPALNWTSLYRIHWWKDSVKITKPQPSSSYMVRQPDEKMKVFDDSRISDLEKQMAFVSERWHQQDEEYTKIQHLLQSFRDQVTQMNDKDEILALIQNVVAQHMKEVKADESSHQKHDLFTLHQEHEWRIVALEGLLARLSEKSEGLQKELELTKAKTLSDAEDKNQHLLSKIQHLEIELAQLKSELLSSQGLRTDCDTMDTLHKKVDAQVKESVKFMLFGDQHGDLPESLLQWLTSRFVSKSDLEVLLQELELNILKNVTLHMSVANAKLSSEVVTNVVNEAGIAGITEAQAQIIVNNALKLYSQDRIGMVDFALESGGGSILSTRCSETYETKTALISLFGIPLWYFSQSPRVVIQPDMYPGNCWAFKGSQGYLVVRLSMMIYPTAFTLEHIPKALSPTGNITSAPKNFSVYGLENEYQEEGLLFGQYMYDQDGEPLQKFQVMETSEKAFQIVELRIFSNWGHTEYTCLYRFRVHGRPAE